MPPKPLLAAIVLTIAMMAQRTQPLQPPPPEQCYPCQGLMIGSYFFDGTEIWVPNLEQDPLSVGNPYFSVEVDWQNNHVQFSSAQFRFCRRPPKIWTYANLTYQDLWLPVCSAEISEAELSENDHQLDLWLDSDFLLCALESDMAGFKFAVPYY